MAWLDANKARWLGGIVIGVVITETLRDGWAGVMMLALGIAGRWLLGKLAGGLFDEEISRLRDAFKPRDPVKQSIWAHAKAGHSGRWKECRDYTCNVFGENDKASMEA